MKKAIIMAAGIGLVVGAFLLYRSRQKVYSAHDWMEREQMKDEISETLLTSDIPGLQLPRDPDDLMVFLNSLNDNDLGNLYRMLRDYGVLITFEADKIIDMEEWKRSEGMIDGLRRGWYKPIIRFPKEETGSGPEKRFYVVENERHPSFKNTSGKLISWEVTEDVYEKAEILFSEYDNSIIIDEPLVAFGTEDAEFNVGDRVEAFVEDIDQVEGEYIRGDWTSGTVVDIDNPESGSLIRYEIELDNGDKDWFDDFQVRPPLAVTEPLVAFEAPKMTKILDNVKFEQEDHSWNPWNFYPRGKKSPLDKISIYNKDGLVYKSQGWLELNGRNIGGISFDEPLYSVKGPLPDELETPAWTPKERELPELFKTDTIFVTSQSPKFSFDKGKEYWLYIPIDRFDRTFVKTDVSHYEKTDTYTDHYVLTQKSNPSIKFDIRVHRNIPSTRNEDITESFRKLIEDAMKGHFQDGEFEVYSSRVVESVNERPGDVVKALDGFRSEVLKSPGTEPLVAFSAPVLPDTQIQLVAFSGEFPRPPDQEQVHGSGTDMSITWKFPDGSLRTADCHSDDWCPICDTHVRENTKRWPHSWWKHIQTQKHKNYLGFKWDREYRKLSEFTSGPEEPLVAFSSPKLNFNAYEGEEVEVLVNEKWVAGRIRLVGVENGPHRGKFLVVFNNDESKWFDKNQIRHCPKFKPTDKAVIVNLKDKRGDNPPNQLISAEQVEMGYPEKDWIGQIVEVLETSPHYFGLLDKDIRDDLIQIRRVDDGRINFVFPWNLEILFDEPLVAFSSNIERAEAWLNDRIRYRGNIITKREWILNDTPYRKYYLWSKGSTTSLREGINERIRSERYPEYKKRYVIFIGKPSDNMFIDVPKYVYEYLKGIPEISEADYRGAQAAGYNIEPLVAFNAECPTSNCVPIDKKGNYDISPEAIDHLEDTIEKLPQTKELNSVDGIYTDDRKKLHDKIIKEYMEGKVCVEPSPPHPIAILTGGVPGSGKSTFIKKFAPWMQKDDKMLLIDADEIRAKLPEYKGWNATQTHMETQDIVFNLLDSIGTPCKTDILYDGTMNKTKKYFALIDKLKSLGYDIYILFMDVPREVSESRVLKRYQRTGRYVPRAVVKEANDAGLSAFKELKKIVDGYILVDGTTYDIKEEGGKPVPRHRFWENTQSRDESSRFSSYMAGSKKGSSYDETMKSLKVYLDAMTTMRKSAGLPKPKGWKYNCMEEFVIKNGKPFKSIPIPDDLYCGKMKMCFRNAASAVLGMNKYRYPEQVIDIITYIFIYRHQL